MKYTAFHEQRFRASVEKALQRVKTILDTTRTPRLAEDEDHTYDDKYALAEFLTNTSIASKMNALERLGLDSDKLQTVSEWVHEEKKSVTLRFEAEDSCSFLKEQDVEVAVGGQREVETTTTTSSSGSGAGFFGGSGTKTETTKTKVVTKVKEYHWKVGVSYKFSVFCGNDPTKSIELQSRTSSTVLITSAGQAVARGGYASKPPTPIKEKTVHPAVDTNLTWFFQMIDPKELICQFSIDRESEKAQETCKTPRRNDDVTSAVDFHRSLFEWTRLTQGFFIQRIEKEILGKHKPAGNDPGILVPLARCNIVSLQKEPHMNGKQVKIIEYISDQQRYRVEPTDPQSGLPPSLLIKPQNLKSIDPAPALSSVSDDPIFCPILPLMENGSVFSMGDVGELLSEQGRSIDEATENLSRVFPPRQLLKLASVAEATIVLMCQHIQRLTMQYNDGVDYIEDMLKQQLVAAIGKEVHTKDFDRFMRFHSQKLFGPQYAPRPFTFAIRRPNRFPDGMLTIECTRQANEPIETWVRQVPGASNSSIYIPITAATSVEITGDRYLHGWMQHKFKSKPRREYQAIVRARQFSSFLVIIGTMMGADRFDPKHAIILQNKDEVLIPLLTNVLPSAKEFKDAIASLSPEQQAFAKAFRGMQLESSVFGVCVIQLKPQLERLLGLPDGALTKEIQLTQDLMSLFIDYQIPSDLLSFDGALDTDASRKLDAVKGYVKSVMEVIDGEKEKQLKEEERKADMRAEMNFTGAGGGGGSALQGDMEEMDMLADASEASTFTEGSRRGVGARLMHLGQAPQAMMAMGAPPGQAMMAASAAEDSYSFATAASVPAAAPMATEQRLLMRKAKRTSGQEAKRSSTPSLPVRVESVQPPAEKSVGPPDASRGSTSSEDFTLIPKILDTKLEKYDTDGALKSTIIKPGLTWKKMRQENLLTPMKSTTLYSGDIETEKKKVFDLLDAISRSGTLPIDCAELHVVIAVSHCFDNDVMGTIIQDNINPIEKVERSSLMVASTIYGKPAYDLIENDQQLQRLTGTFPLLFGAEPSEDAAVEIYHD